MGVEGFQKDVGAVAFENDFQEIGVGEPIVQAEAEDFWMSVTEMLSNFFSFRHALSPSTIFCADSLALLSSLM